MNISAPPDLFRYVERLPSARLLREAIEGIGIDLATVADAEALTGLFATFFAEAHYRDRGIVYSPERARNWLEGVLSTGTVPHVVARTPSNDIVGVCSFGMDSTFCERPVAVLHTIFLLPDRRRSAIGLLLLSVAMDMAKEDGAVAWHAPLASGLREQASLANLLKRCGCEEIGVMLGRRL